MIRNDNTIIVSMDNVKSSVQKSTGDANIQSSPDSIPPADAETIQQAQSAIESMIAKLRSFVPTKGNAP